MKKQGILNSHISKVLSDLGHTDQIVIADAGLPIPEGILKIDLAIKCGVPSFIEVVQAIANDMVIEKIIIAAEMEQVNSVKLDDIKNLFFKCHMERVTHEEFKQLTKRAKAIIRTGEVTPFANCILQSGVFFS